ncbi:MAG: preprotein translocase subunit SecA, partial [Leptospiraceae bacterium]|nr:preprotein translocase subunit SecA [Leptospiraceae bacterium]
PKLSQGADYEVDEKAHNVLLTEAGVGNVEKILGVENLYSPENVELVHHIHQALKAHKIFHKNVNYVVQNGEVVIVDEFTGRMMPGRRYSDGLHQALEAKERVTIARESQTLASITFQNYFRIYTKLAGMTGTADTEAEEFKKIYNLDVIVIPPNVPMVRKDYPDKVYRTEREKFDAIIKEIQELQKKGQPVLVGTISIEKSELLSDKLKRLGLLHNVLNAKFHEKEAEIIANAGKPSSITIATNMAGRGTDIVLGGIQVYKDQLDSFQEDESAILEFKQAVKKLDFENAKNFVNGISSQIKRKKAEDILGQAILWKERHDLVLEKGGLFILGTERHEARRIDNQLRGRSGRQGDPGASRFYLSLEDDLMRIFGSDRISSIMLKLGMEEGQEIEHKMVTNAIARSQKRVESHNFDIRKHLLEYDDVMNRQRMFIYKIRNDVLYKNDVSELIYAWIDEVVENQILTYCDGNNPNSWDLAGINEWLVSINLELNIQAEDFLKGKAQLLLFEHISSKAKEAYSAKMERVTKDIWSSLERSIFLDILDHRWKEHLYTMDHLREGIWTVGYGEKNPLVEYKLQGFKLFDQMVDNLKREIIVFLFRVEVTDKTEWKEEKTEYKKIGEESLDFQLGGQGEKSFQSNITKRKINTDVSNSAGGASERKSSRRRKK